jgi:hypothetical protein
LLRGFGAAQAVLRLPSFAPAVFQTLSIASPGSVVVTHESGHARGNLEMALATSRMSRAFRVG